MSRAAALAALSAACLAITACPRPPPAAQIVSLNLSPGTTLTRGSSFVATASGRGVVFATFGPRQVTRVAEAPSYAVTFSADEFPEGLATLTVGMQRTTPVVSSARVRIDRSPPELVRLVRTRLGVGHPLELLVWDNLMLARVEAVFGGRTFTWAGPQLPATTALIPVHFDVSSMPEGDYTLQVRLVDAAGNEATVERQGLVLDRTAPTVAFTSPASGARVTGLLEVAVSAVDTVGPTSVEIRGSGSFLGTVSGPSGSLTVDTSFFPRGLLELEAVARDGADNVGAPAKVSVTVE